MIPYELHLTSTTFSDTIILTYRIYLPLAGKKIGFNLLDDEDFTITYVIDTIPNSPASNKLPTHDKKNVWFIDINGEEPMKSQGALDEIQRHRNPQEKYNVKISLCIRKSQNRTYLEEIRYRLDQDL